MYQFKAKFFGAKHRKEQITKQLLIVEAINEAAVENVLRRKGWCVIHGLKIRKVC